MVDNGGTPLAARGALPYLPAKHATISAGERMLVAAYPAELVGGETIADNFYPTTAFANVIQKYTFEDTRNTDLFSVGGSVVSQSGSSGGAAVRADGTLAGLISTASLDGATSERQLRAITIGHINRSLAAQGAGSLATLLEGNLQSKALTFESETAPRLIDLLVDALED